MSQKTEVEFLFSGDSPELGNFKLGEKRKVKKEIATTLINRGIAKESKTKKGNDAK